MNKDTCIGPDCTRPAHYIKKRLCKAHDTQIRRSGTLKALTTFTTGCWFEGCQEIHKANGLCAGHYAQQTRGKKLTELVDRRRVKPIYRSRRSAEEIRFRDANGDKQCRICAQWLPESGYSKKTSNTDGLSAGCKGCMLATNRKVQARNYGLTPEGRDALFVGQGSRCAVCKADKPGASGWHTDHDHSCCPPGTRSCGKCVRGILCRACNLAIGMVKDNPETLRALAFYLESSKQLGV